MLKRENGMRIWEVSQETCKNQTYPLRIGEVVGIHAVNISIATPILILRHETQSRALFAEGTLCAAEFLAEQEPGLYNMKSMI